MALLTWLFCAILILILFVVFAIAVSLRQNAKHFKIQGIPYIGTGLHHTVKLLLGSTNMIEIEMETYKSASKIKSPLVGLSDFSGARCVYITDLELLKNIYVRDFDHFVNRRSLNTRYLNRYVKRMLPILESDNWKGTRVKLSPSFTTGKIRKLFDIFSESGSKMETFLRKEISSGTTSLDLSKVFSKYTMDVIANCCFGVNSESWDCSLQELSTFEKMAKTFGGEMSGKLFLKFLLMATAPKLADKLGIDLMDPGAQEYFSNGILNAVKRRRETGERKEDFLQLMMDTQQGLLEKEEEAVDPGSELGGNLGDTQKLTFDEDSIIANSLMFLVAGFDTTLSVLLFTIYCLALDPKVQENLREEVELVMDKCGDKLTYEGVSEMVYLDMVINESMRLYPPAPSGRTERTCTRDYAVPGKKLTIEKGTVVLMPIYAIHHDPQYFPDPEKFIPERFSKENKNSRHPFSYSPFGYGPRSCIGMRFALIKVKVAIALLIKSFEFSPCSQTKIPVELGSSVIMKPKDGMWLSVIRRKE